MDEFEMDRNKNKNRYNHSSYLNLLKSCKTYGYKKKSKGKPSLDELYRYIYENINIREPIHLKPTKKYDTTYYQSLLSEALWNGFVYPKTGKISMNTFKDYLNSKGVKLPINTKMIKPKTNNLLYHKSLKDLARQNGFVHKIAGNISIDTLTEFLEDNNISLPEQTVLINLKRITFSQCKSNFSRLCFIAKSLGYIQHQVGCPSNDQLNDYISKNS